MHADRGWTERLTAGDEVYLYRPWQGRKAPSGYSVATVTKVTATLVKIGDDAYYRGEEATWEGTSRGRNRGIYRSYIYPKNRANDERLERLKAEEAAAAARRKLREKVIFAAGDCDDDDALNQALTILTEKNG